MVIQTRKTKSGIIFLPRPTKRPTCSIIIEDVEYKTELLDYLIKRNSDIAPSSATLTIQNFSGQNTTKFSESQVVKIYTDFSAGTKKVFEGKIFKPKLSNAPDTVFLEARDYGQDAKNRNVYKEYTTPTAISTIFTDLIGEYLPTHTVTNVSSLSTTATIAWNGKNVWDCLKDLVALTGNTYTFYCDFDKDWHFFERTSNISTLEALSYTRNLRRISPLSTLSDVKNKITVFGKKIEGLPLFYSKETGYGDNASDLVIRDSNLSTLDMIKDKVDQLVTANQVVEKRGSGLAMGMPDLNPSDKIYIFAPKQNIQGWYIIPSFSLSLKRHRFETRFDFQEEKKEIKDLVSFLEERKTVEQGISEIENEHNLDSSVVMDFEDSTYIGATSEKVEALDDYLQLESGESSGTFKSIAHETDANVSSFCLRVKGDALTGMTFYISVDNGVSYQTVIPNTKYSTTSEGTKIVVKIIFTSSTQKIKALSLEYN